MKKRAKKSIDTGDTDPIRRLRDRKESADGLTHVVHARLTDAEMDRFLDLLPRLYYRRRADCLRDLIRAAIVYAEIYDPRIVEAVIQLAINEGLPSAEKRELKRRIRSAIAR